MTSTGRVSTEDRERAALRVLKDEGHPEHGLGVKEIWERSIERLGDEVTQQAFYKLMTRLEVTGKVEAVPVGENAPRRYRLAAFLHAENAMTLDDLYQEMEVISAPDAIARFIDARDYFEENRLSTVRAAAEALLSENPRELVTGMIESKVRALNADIELLKDEALRDRALEARVDMQIRELKLIAYRYLGLSRAAVDVARAEAVKEEGVKFDPPAMQRELRHRVFGENFIEVEDIRNERQPAIKSRLTVAGSDGSTHASVMQLTSATTFMDDVGYQDITFNNSVAFVQFSEMDAKIHRGVYPYHSVPMTRSALEDRSTVGMIMAPFMYRDLSESEYEHMAKCATDVVQWRIDEAIASGTARSLKDGALLPRPSVHIRDGTITPQEREFGHYSRLNAYGDMVRNGIALSRKVLDRVRLGKNPPVFAGAVKSTSLKLFSSILNWYIVEGSRLTRGRPIDPNWNLTRATHISDNDAMTVLLSSLEERRVDGQFFVTCVICRPFHSLTEFFSRPESQDFDWVGFFAARRDGEIQRWNDEDEHDPPYLASVMEVSEDDYVVMCERADYAMFFIGHSAGDPPPLTPRYEFLTSLRSRTAEDAHGTVRSCRHKLVSAVDASGLSADKDHNYLSRKFLIKVIPHVIFDAHEKCKSLGRQLEQELRSIVIARLREMKKARGITAKDIEFAPMSVRRFVEKYINATRRDRGQNDDGVGR